MTATGHESTVSGHNDLAALYSVGEQIRNSVGSVMHGKDAIIDVALTVLMAQGHLLLEDVPGVGKTMLAKALGRSIGGRVNRIQFTPDLLPSDITGVSIYNQETRDFEFKPGPIFANVVVGDEINRASPKTQAALLESMEERQVSVDGVTYRLQSPFLVVATQNPVDMDGTFALPEAQRDRFMARISVGYPDADSEVRMLSSHGSSDPLSAVRPVTDVTTISTLMSVIPTVTASSSVLRYIVDLIAATRVHPDLTLGASPRAGLQLLRAARSRAALRGRDYITPDDVQVLTHPTLAHRLVLSSAGRRAGHSADAVLNDVLHTVAVHNR